MRDHQVAVAGGTSRESVTRVAPLRARRCVLPRRGVGDGRHQTHEGICARSRTPRAVSWRASTIAARRSSRTDGGGGCYRRRAGSSTRRVRWASTRDGGRVRRQRGRKSRRGRRVDGARSRRTALSRQVLVYPITDAISRGRLHRERGGYLLTSESMRFYWERYVPNTADRDQPYVSPMRAASVAGLPPALVITAEYDPLRDEGEAYAQKLAQGGVPGRRAVNGHDPRFFRFTNVMDSARARWPKSWPRCAKPGTTIDGTGRRG